MLVVSFISWFFIFFYFLLSVFFLSAFFLLLLFFIIFLSVRFVPLRISFFFLFFSFKFHVFAVLMRPSCLLTYERKRFAFDCITGWRTSSVTCIFLVSPYFFSSFLHLGCMCIAHYFVLYAVFRALMCEKYEFYKYSIGNRVWNAARAQYWLYTGLPVRCAYTIYFLVSTRIILLSAVVHLYENFHQLTTANSSYDIIMWLF